MTYRIEFTRTAIKQFEKLDKMVQNRILSSLERIKVRPYDFVERLVGYDYFRLRTGNYRLILEIKENLLLIFVVEVGHRKNIYKNLQ